MLANPSSFFQYRSLLVSTTPVPVKILNEMFNFQAIYLKNIYLLNSFRARLQGWLDEKKIQTSLTPLVASYDTQEIRWGNSIAYNQQG